MMKQAWWLALVVVAACGGKSDEVEQQPPRKPIAPKPDELDGIVLRLSDGTHGPAAYDHAKLAPAQKLGDADVAALLARTKPLVADAADHQTFALRPASQPPPLTGDTIHTAFPGPATNMPPPASADASKPLRVLRWTPEGDVPNVPQLTVTFSQPMIAVSSQDAAATVVPLKLAPQPKGHWRWIGTRTIVFDPDGGAFPHATTYAVTIPAGTKGVVGAALDKAVTFSFVTPPPTKTRVYPTSDRTRTDVPMFIEFDQRIDPARVLAKLRVIATPRLAPDAKDRWTQPKPIAMQVQLLDKAAIAKVNDKQFTELVASLEKIDDGRWLAFRTTKPLPVDAAIQIDLGPGVPSREGPNVTTAIEQIAFETYPPLRVAKAECYGEHCPPGSTYHVELDNPLDVDAFDPKLVTISPSIPDVQITATYNDIYIVGPTRPRATYTVTIAGTLKDEFGQTLGKPDTEVWSVGDMAPQFSGPAGTIVLDPNTPPKLDYFTTNYETLTVKLVQVEPSDYAAFQKGVWFDPKAKRPGVALPVATVAIPPSANLMSETDVDLAKALHGGHGQVVAIVEPRPAPSAGSGANNYSPQLVTWVQATHLAVDAYVDHEQLVAFVTDLATGAPAAGATIELHPSGAHGISDERGLATIALPHGSSDQPTYLVAKKGDDTTILDGDDWYAHAQNTELVWHVVDDRDLYRPGEQVSIKGWLRAIDQGKHGDVAGVAGKVSTVTYKVTDSESRQIATGTAKVGGAGAFDFRFTLPKTPNLGSATIELAAHGALTGEDTHEIRIEEFRRPEFSVTAHAGTEPVIVGGATDVTVDATYFAGGPLGGAETTWNLAAVQTTYAPPNHDDYVFGVWRAWWGDSFTPNRRRGRNHMPPRPTVGTSSWRHDGKTDGAGEHVLHVDAVRMSPTLPYTVTAGATVFDTNRQAYSASTSFVVHPASVYVGVKTLKPFVEQGQPYEVGVIGVDIDGKPAAGAKIDVEVMRLASKWEKGEYVSEEVEPQHCNVVAAKEPGSCKFATTTGGRYKLRARIVDAKGRTNLTEQDFWVTGGAPEPSREVTRELVNIIPDKKEYSAGNTAELLIQSPFYPAEGVVTWRRSGIVKTERITLDKSTAVITVPISDDMVPNVFVQIDLVGAAPRLDEHGTPDAKLPKRPAYASGSIDLEVPPKQRTLAVKVTPSATKVGPGDKASVAVEVTDAAGKPVPNAEVTLFVVDDAILTLAGYELADPIATFYTSRDAGARDYYERALIRLAKPTDPALVFKRSGYGPGGGGSGYGTIGTGRYGTIGHGSGTGSGYGVGGGRGGMRSRAIIVADKMLEDQEMPDPNKPEPPMKINLVVGKPPGPAEPTTTIAVRSNFDPLAAFAPAVATDADGKAQIPITMPDNLTRYRIIAIAAAGEHNFGKGESALTARLPLMVRPSLPRFLDFGDTFQLPIVVQNQTDAAMTVKLAVAAANLTLTDGAGRQVTVPANDRVLVELPAAAVDAGTARVQIAASAGNAGADAADVSLPVWTPATTEAFATYGVIDGSAAGGAGASGGNVIKQPIALPPNVIPQYGELEVSTASTNLQALTDALLYIVHYPFECSEQRSSRILAIAGLRDVLAAFHAKGLPSAAAMEHSIAVDVDFIAKLQNGDGGFAYWKRGEDSVPYVTVFVAHALAMAKTKGYAVPAELLANVKTYLAAIDDHIPDYYSAESREELQAFAFYTLAELGTVDIARAKLLVAASVGNGAKHFSLDAAGWLLGAIAQNAALVEQRKALVRFALDHATETAGAASFATTYGADSYFVLASAQRSAGIMLDALIREQPDLDLIPKLVTGLLASRRAGRWESTQDNVFVLTALDRYFHTYEKLTPSFVARVWLGSDSAGEHAFRGRTTETSSIAIAMRDVAAHDKQDLTIQKDGTGRLYYRIGLTYAPADLRIAPSDNGFIVERHYEPVDDPKDVARDRDGTWHVKAGARVRIRVAMVNDGIRHHVALVDPMPAGFEALNPEFASTGPIPLDPKQQAERGAYWWYASTWYEHQNMRDERVEAFAAELWAGVHEYVYVARATTRGTFTAAPPKAEEMYMPETFGRGGSDRVIVE